MRKNKTFHIYNKKTLVIPAVFLFIFLFISLASASENLSTWYINNPTNNLTVNSSRITFFNNADTKPITYVSKGFSYLDNNFIANFTLNASSLYGVSSYCSGIFSYLKNNSSQFNNNDNDLMVTIANESDNNFRIGIMSGDSFASFLTFDFIQKDVKYYLTIERRAGMLNFSVYNDVVRTSLNSSTQTIDLNALANPLGDYNYIHLVKSIDESVTTLGNYYIEDFSIVDLTAKKGTSGNLFDLAFNYGTEDEPLWVRILISLSILSGIAYFILDRMENPNIRRGI